MNFFKSVFSDDPDPPGTESESDSPRSNKEDENPEQSNPIEDDGDGSVWSFGGLMKTLATRSESVIETYRRDLEEFGSGLKKEIEVAQGSLGTVGHAIDEIGNTVLKGTADIIAQGKEVILAAGNESDSSDNSSSKSSSRRDSLNSKPYSRFDAQIRVVQGDVNTYCEEPEDLDDYKKWQSEFSLTEKALDIEKFLEENGEMRGVYKKVVPNMVDQETFWFRYFYKVHKLKQAEDLRANLVKRARSLDVEEELSWDIDDDDDDDDEDNDKNSKKVTEATKEASKLKLEGNADSVTEVSNVSLKTNTDSEEKKETDLKESKTVLDVSDDKVPLQDSGKSSPVPASHEASPSQDSDKPETLPASQESAHSKDSDKSSSLEAAQSQDSSKSEDVSVSHKDVQSQESGNKPEGASSSSSSSKQPLEEELGWDEIEDMSGIDNKEVVTRSSDSPNRAELRKRLSVAEEDEDLTWDIEDEEEEEEASKSTKG